MSYQVTPKDALISAGRMMKEAGAHAVKLEGGSTVRDTVKKMGDAGIPVMGHRGLTPQSIYKCGTYKVRAQEEEEADTLVEEAKLLEQAGCFAIVLEKIPAKLAKKVTDELTIPTIGIGASAECDGQILVLEDMLGLNPNPPKFVKQYGKLLQGIEDAVERYSKDVKSRAFPTKDQTYQIKK